MKKTKAPKKTMIQYGFGTGLSQQLFTAGAGYLANSALGGLNTILGDNTPQYIDPLAQIQEGGQIMAFGGDVDGQGPKPIITTNPKDPRLKKYIDSLNLYSAGEKIKKTIEKSGLYYNNPQVTPAWPVDVSGSIKSYPTGTVVGKHSAAKMLDNGIELTHPMDKTIQPKKNYTYTRKESDFPDVKSYTDWLEKDKNVGTNGHNYDKGWIGFGVDTYKKPTQPVQLQKDNPRPDALPAAVYPDADAIIKFMNNPVLSQGQGTILPSDKAMGKSNDYYPNLNRTTPTPTTQHSNGYFAMGGTVNGQVEVEGGEVAQTPDGQLGQFQGPSHEDGGIPANLPSGTKIYSDRLAVDGKTMQQRKLARERTLAKLTKLTDKNPTDAASKNTFNRTKAYLDKEEQSDLMMQHVANQTYQIPQAKIDQSQTADANIDDQDQQYAYGTDPSGTPAIPYSPFFSPYQSTMFNSRANPIDTITERPNDGMDYTEGDKTGFLGNIIGAVAPLATTIANRAGDKPNINPYQNFGKNAIAANSKAMDYVNRLTNTNIDNINTQATSQRARNRNSASGVNTSRALDLATTAQQNSAVNNIYANNEQQIAGLYDQEAKLDNQQDLYVGQGISMQDKANRMDRDAYFSNLGQNFGNISNLFQKTGKEMNEHKMSNDMLDILPELNKYGLGFTYDETGKPIMTKLKN